LPPRSTVPPCHECHHPGDASCAPAPAGSARFSASMGRLRPARLGGPQLREPFGCADCTAAVSPRPIGTLRRAARGARPGGQAACGSRASSARLPVGAAPRPSPSQSSGAHPASPRPQHDAPHRAAEAPSMPVSNSAFPACPPQPSWRIRARMSASVRSRQRAAWLSLCITVLPQRSHS